MFSSASCCNTPQTIQRSLTDPIKSTCPTLLHLFSIKAIFLCTLILTQCDSIDILHLWSQTAGLCWWICPVFIIVNSIFCSFFIKVNALFRSWFYSGNNADRALCFQAVHHIFTKITFSGELQTAVMSQSVSNLAAPQRDTQYGIQHQSMEEEKWTSKQENTKSQSEPHIFI